MALKLLISSRTTTKALILVLLLMLLVAVNYVAASDEVVLTSVNKKDNGNNRNDNNTEDNATFQQVVSTERKLRRGKRYLDFNKGTRMSWRSTVKNNIIKVNTLWGHGFGLRANFPFADKADRRRPFFKRDILHTMEDLLNGHGFDGRACVLKSYCTAVMDEGSNISAGMMFKLLQMLFSLDVHEKRAFPHLRTENCQQILHSHCPLSFNSISPFTDDV